MSCIRHARRTPHAHLSCIRHASCQKTPLQFPRPIIKWKIDDQVCLQAVHCCLCDDPWRAGIGVIRGAGGVRRGRSGQILLLAEACCRPDRLRGGRSIGLRGGCGAGARRRGGRICPLATTIRCDDGAIRCARARWRRGWIRRFARFRWRRGIIQPPREDRHVARRHSCTGYA